MRRCTRRFKSLIVDLTKPKSEFLTLKAENPFEAPLKLPLVWLRDHCRSDKSYNPETNQRRSNGIDFFNPAKVDDPSKISLDVATQFLTVQWSDSHQSKFLASDLLKWSTPTFKVQTSNVRPTSLPSLAPNGLQLWDKASLAVIPSVNYRQPFDFTSFYEAFVRYGIATVNGIPPESDATRVFCQSISTIQNTFFGKFWTFGTDEGISDRHDDTAYGSDGIGPHTDGTYFNHTPGIQVFHCLQPAITGGESFFVDGFHVADEFRRDHPLLFDVLTQTLIDHHYIENPGLLYVRSLGQPVIRLTPDGRSFAQIRYNPYDRAPMAISEHIENTVAFYEAYEAFSKAVNDPKNAIRTFLDPGTVIFVDNFRVFHARTSFTGPRIMCGCYLARDDFLGKARTFLSEDLIDYQ